MSSTKVKGIINFSNIVPLGSQRVSDNFTNYLDIIPTNTTCYNIIITHFTNILFFNNKTVLKLYTSSVPEYENYIQNIFFLHGLAPKILNFKKLSHNTGAILMEQIYMDLFEYIIPLKNEKKIISKLFNKIELVLRKLHLLKLRHGDANWKNWALDHNMNIILLDFASSSYYPNDNQHDSYFLTELVHMARTLENFPIHLSSLMFLNLQKIHSNLCIDFINLPKTHLYLQVYLKSI
jgi:hypothetical protein